MRALLIFSLVYSFAFAGTTEPEHIWRKKSINVCWWDKGTKNLYSLKVINPTLHKILNAKYYDVLLMQNSRKEIIKKNIVDTYTLDETGIRFIGWKDCSMSKNSDVIIYAINDFKIKTQFKNIPANSSHYRYEHKQVMNFIKNSSNSSNVALIDANHIKNEPQAHLIIYENNDTLKLYTNEYLKLNAIHEFGHLAGLRHEDIRREEAYKSQYCRISPDTLKNNYESKGDQTSFTSNYDQESIMCYCYFLHLADISYYLKTQKINKITERISYLNKFLKPSCNLQEQSCLNKSVRLSKADKHALKCLYKYDKNQKETLCHEDYDVGQL